MSLFILAPILFIWGFILVFIQVVITESRWWFIFIRFVKKSLFCRNNNHEWERCYHDRDPKKDWMKCEKCKTVKTN